MKVLLFFLLFMYFTQVLSNNLGRPNDHFSVTPFEAVYISEYFILPHIDYKNLTSNEVVNYVRPINEFIKNEVEPCYLYLQNEHLGAQARSNYTYKSFRRANNVITTGNLVTPSTDPGDYVVEANAKLVLEAGKEIVLKPGTHIKAGANVHLKINYEPCPGYPRPCELQGIAQNTSLNETKANHVYDDITNELNVSANEEVKDVVGRVDTF